MRNRITIGLLLFGLCAAALFVFSGQLEGVLFQEKAKPLTEEEKKVIERIEELRAPSKTHFFRGEYDDALAAAKEMGELQPHVIQHQLFLGDVAFAACDMPTSIEAFNSAAKLNPGLGPYLWQRGLAQYYAERYKDGVKQFETHQTVNSQDVENAVWHLLCAARFSDVEKARKKLIPITGDTRIPMSQVYEMFAGRMKPEEVIKAAHNSGGLVQPGTQRHNLQLYYAHLYIGLYHEMLGKQELAIESMKEAQKINPLPKNNFMGVVAHVHLKLRNPESEKEDKEQKSDTESTKEKEDAAEPSSSKPDSDQKESKESDK